MVYIKKMVMTGFKSFARRTEVLFDKGVNIILGANGSGKSCSYDTLVTLANGDEIEIGNLVERQISLANNIKKLDDGVYVDGNGSIEIISLNKESMKSEKKTVSKFIKRDGEIVYKIKTRTGKELKATGCHPVMTFSNDRIDSVLVRDLDKGAAIATPRQINAGSQQTDCDFARLIGYIIGDGYIAKDRIEFINADKEIIDDFIHLTKDKFNLDIRERHEKRVTRIYIRNKKFVKEIRNLFYKNYKGSITSEIKKIPQSFMSSNKDAISNLLAGLYDTDGSVRKDIAIIELCTKNKDLAHQIQGLLLRFGVISKIKERMCCAVNTEKKIKRKYFYIYTYGIKNFEKFNKNISLKVPHKKNNILTHINSNVIPNQNMDLLPKEANYYVKELACLLGIHVKPIKKEYPSLRAYIENKCLISRDGITRLLPLFKSKFNILSQNFLDISLDQNKLISFMDNLNISSAIASKQLGLHSTIIRNQWATNRFHPRKENLQRFYELVKNGYLSRLKRIKELISLLESLANSDIYWDEIVSIEKLGKEEFVYDLTIEDNHNFIANNIFAHNSNIADSLCFVLGRLSIKSIRAAKAKNLLFMGSKFIKPVKEASVELVFDNTDRAFAIDKDEISLMRIVRHNGQSIYKINSEVKTRAEIIELLAQGGIDPHGFNIVLQGQIQYIVRMHPEERRKIIEEVAGISIYESKKEKSLHELEKTDEKLKEISAILRERTIYLKNLEKERAQAMRFKELEQTQKRLKASILVKRIDDKLKELEKIIKSIDEKSQQKDKEKVEVEKIQKQIESLQDQINQINKNIQQATGVEQESLHTHIANIKAELEGLRVRKENFENRKFEVERRIAEMKNSIPSLELEIAELRKESPLVAKKAQELKKKKDELSKIEEERNKLFNFRTELFSLKEITKDKERQLSRANSDSESILRQIEEISRRVMSKSEESCSSEIAAMKKSLAEKEIRISTIYALELKSEKVISVAESEIARAEKIKSQVEKIDICPLCQSKITKEHIDHVFSYSDERISQFKSQLSSSQEEISKLKDEKSLLSNDIKGIKEKVSDLELELLKHKNIKDKKEQLKNLVSNEKSIRDEIVKTEERRKNLEVKIIDLPKIQEKYDSIVLEIEEISSRTKEDTDTSLLYKEREIENVKNIIKHSTRDLQDIQVEINNIEQTFENKNLLLQQKEKQETELTIRFKKMFESRDEMQLTTQQKNINLSELQSNIRQIEDQINYLKIGKAKIDAEKEVLEMEVRDFAGLEIIKASFESLDERLKKTSEALLLIGSINMRALEVYDEIKKEYDSVQEKVNILEKEKADIMKIIDEIDKKKIKSFMKTFKAMNSLFTENFSKLYSKGIAYLEIENPEDVFAGGVNIVVKLAKGKYFDVTSLSGGEQTLVALSLLFAIQEYRPYHFYIFDEIDAALDKRNSENLAALLNQYMKSGQYIVITHNDSIIMSSNVLYGVSMHEGVSKILSLKINGKPAPQNQQTPPSEKLEEKKEINSESS